eukprot:NODE_2248_length_497_cov_183.516043_g2231_i0.p1 GENE.NODE_2248_length_497_cov_183.516043_g2231_i0~~NODE_2248_length_497_cov_183.516043_g2231_i0.p1  ORF type:complete len:131 (-),score=10.92 NODE_2248_length_497_cov_183.516043_g2231_i0:55-447(-)
MAVTGPVRMGAPDMHKHRRAEQFRFSDCSLEEIRQGSTSLPEAPAALVAGITAKLGRLSQQFGTGDTAPASAQDFTVEERRKIEDSLASALCSVVRLASVCDVDLARTTTQRTSQKATPSAFTARKGGGS